MFFVVAVWVVWGIAAWLGAVAITRRRVVWSESEDLECAPVFVPGIAVVATAGVLEYSLALKSGLTLPEWVLPVQVLTSMLLLVVIGGRGANSTTGRAG